MVTQSDVDSARKRFEGHLEYARKMRTLFLSTLEQWFPPACATAAAAIAQKLPAETQMLSDEQLKGAKSELEKVGSHAKEIIGRRVDRAEGLWWDDDPGPETTVTEWLACKVLIRHCIGEVAHVLSRYYRLSRTPKVIGFEMRHSENGEVVFVLPIPDEPPLMHAESLFNKYRARAMEAREALRELNQIERALAEANARSRWDST